MSSNPNVSFGRSLLDAVASQIPTFGRLLVVANSNDSADLNYQYASEVFPDGQYGRIMFFTDLATAYAEAQTNNNDVICLMAHTSHKVTSMLTVAKNRVHFIGFDGGGRKIGSRTLISNTGAGAATDVAMVTITGTGCTFRNIKFANNWTVAQNLYSVDDQGIQTYFENCDIENLGSAHLTNASAASLGCSGSESIFTNCTIGQDTLLITSTAGQQCLIKAKDSGTRSTRNRFDRCRFQAYTSDTTHVFIRSAAASMDRDHVFDDCEFANTGAAASSGVTLAVAFASSATAGGNIFIGYPRVYRATQVGTAAVGNTNQYVVSATIVATNAVGLVTT